MVREKTQAKDAVRDDAVLVKASAPEVLQWSQPCLYPLRRPVSANCWPHFGVEWAAAFLDS